MKNKLKHQITASGKLAFFPDIQCPGKGDFIFTTQSKSDYARYF
ncbi:hypothetical protein F941_01695 [Acinetobacter bouvetii DSM 14964 = CIP 107468]|uniref:Uncharacterized protein n=1 Tax=Acinetobacter bouvetii DSM 14964 = CIP 107468 TaxID=1120925 RepID=N9DJT5_9GAMM|nr:hypothetical protein F941_01695 [Acinetobacter bouvetii DSM 14964 = CIP 107468]